MDEYKRMWLNLKGSLLRQRVKGGTFFTADDVLILMSKVEISVQGGCTDAEQSNSDGEADA